MKRSSFLYTVGLIVAAAAPTMAQQQPKDSSHRTPVPADARPPKGMCRIWIDGVPAAQQPAATDCASAVRNRPSNGRVIFGDDFADTNKSQSDKSKLPPNAKGFTGVKPPKIVLPTRPPA
ncbi:MAG TPA: hypothetical protein VGM50_11555 [Gemmatimonadaceae bacterium]|jgi:hypothetical protein